ncbi:hypothetical protein DENSPDRAFT_880977 [Dentipellis sp. KUC8613]|nr:hypothetical protein DENSPDRAFT_880977 [Dentipellis sp. KUC8613]
MDSEKDHVKDDKIDAKATAISADEGNKEVESKAHSAAGDIKLADKRSVEDSDSGLDDDDDDEEELEDEQASDDPEGEHEEHPDEGAVPSILERFQPRGPPKRPIASGRPKPKPK